MKNKITFLSCFLLLILSFSCSNKKPFEWLQGTWRESSNKSPIVFHETWSAEKNYFHGFGFEVEGSDTTYIEELYLQQLDGVWNYRALVPSEHGDDTINFKLLTDVLSDSLVFSNPENDFPAVITYIRRSDRKMEVVLEPSLKLNPAGDEMYILYFERKLIKH